VKTTFNKFKFFLLTLLGRFIGIFGSCILATFSIVFSFTLAIFIFYEAALCGSVCSCRAPLWLGMPESLRERILTPRRGPQLELVLVVR
jgi:hypothetical protein